MKVRKIMAVLAMPFCFAWLVWTVIDFWEHMVNWSNVSAGNHGSMFLYVILKFIAYNIPTVFILFLCSKAFEDK